MIKQNIDLTPWPENLARKYRSEGYWIDQPLTRGIRQKARVQPDAVAIICGSRSMSYAEVEQRFLALARRFSAAGLGRGDTALVQLPNCAEFYLTFLALLQAGIAPVNALFNHKQNELNTYADQIHPSLLIADRSQPLFKDDHYVELLKARTDNLSTALFRGGSGEDDLENWIDPSLDGLQDISESVIENGPTDPDQIAFFQLSGGSTGTPKLVPRTHNDYDYSIRASAEICGLSQDTRFLCALPAPHNFLLSSPGALGVFHAGGTVVLAANPDPQTCFPIISRHKVTMAALVPSAVSMWLRSVEQAQSDPASENHDLSTLELVQVGGASVAESDARRVPKVLGCALQQVFGMAEGLVNYTRLDDDPEIVFTTQGRPISADDEVRVIDEYGQDVPDGQTGMLATRGPYTFRGYFRSPEANAKSFDDQGFYFSGDLVQRLPSGHLRVVGRVKDLINRGGEKIAAEEIETLLLRHPQVIQAALVAVEDVLLGEKSCAFIVAQGALRPVALRRHLVELGVADYKLPDRVQFIDALPLTAVGKTDKRALRRNLSYGSATIKADKTPTPETL
ncbi:(2,3-dihydroxybenzoyl)adenylate synthase [Ruegeria sp. Ofav3-42]|uniref:(2,3-dihydroxybenzoyl)adenylate synthase n=1 Tax=Ruegeria sp. Ofav3-42 TaxID=2917759 RepID=UPI001EF6D55B|nr:(2,3-dihydroxybenzoyl)adenylate synthase [Ruegeria sp. Ofav3-42]MCG7521801.1 (2,3-dihydroxybenzoyl)adenylate synthase [Ruegeria sp. Ofav3-42]